MAPSPNSRLQRKHKTAFLEHLLCAEAFLCVTSSFTFRVKGPGDGVHQSEDWVWPYHVLPSSTPSLSLHICVRGHSLDSPQNVARGPTPARDQVIGHSA